MRNLALRLLCLGLAGLGFLEARDGADLVLILADDLGYRDTGVYGRPQIPSQAIDSLAADGLCLTQAHVNSPVCGPSRAGLMTGRHPLSFGCHDNLSKPQPGSAPEAYGLPLSERVMIWRYTVGSATRKGEWKLLKLPDRAPALYNLRQDIADEHDLAANFAQVAHDLNRALDQMELRLPDPLFREPADWRIRHLRFYDSVYQPNQTTAARPRIPAE